MMVMVMMIMMMINNGACAATDDDDDAMMLVITMKRSEKKRTARIGGKSTVVTTTTEAEKLWMWEARISNRSRSSSSSSGSGGMTRAQRLMVMMMVKVVAQVRQLYSIEQWSPHCDQKMELETVLEMLCGERSPLLKKGCADKSKARQTLRSFSLALTQDINTRLAVKGSKEKICRGKKRKEELFYLSFDVVQHVQPQQSALPSTVQGVSLEIFHCHQCRPYHRHCCQ